MADVVAALYLERILTFHKFYAQENNIDFSVGHIVEYNKRRISL